MCQFSEKKAQVSQIICKRISDWKKNKNISLEEKGKGRLLVLRMVKIFAIISRMFRGERDRYI